MRSNLTISAAQLVCAASVLLVLARCQDVFPRLELGGKVLANNSYILRSRIKQGENKTLKCVTDNRFCCSNTSGNWYNQQGNNINCDSSYCITFGEREINLTHTRHGTVGTFRCDIPNFNGEMESLYIYIGTQKLGEGTLDSIEISFEYHFCYCEIPEFTLTCVSEGGPATTVMWWRDGEPVQEDSNHETSQIIVDTSENTIYNNTLRIRGREGGQYKCSVSNNLSDYAPWRAPLSRITTSLTVEVAEEPTNLSSCWQSNTSLLISWSSPSVTPTGYMLYYKRINETNYRSYEVPGGGTQNHDIVLNNLSIEANYSILMQALSDHLPSKIVGIGDSTISVPEPSITISVVGNKTPHVGNNIALECKIQLDDGISYSDIEVNVRWLKGSHVFTEQIQQINTTRVYSTLSLPNLLESDKGRYQCEVTLTALNGNSLPCVATSHYQLDITVPSLIVQTSPAGVRILDTPPYNSFLVTCIAWAEVDRKRVPLKISVDWMKWVEPQTNTGPIVQPSNISFNACVLDELSDEIYVYSTLKCNETDGDSSITYRCCASIELDANKHKREFSDSHIVVAGPTNPVRPLFVRVTDSNSSSAKIQWTISSIAYTNETYYVKYGTNSNELNMTSGQQHSGNNIRILDKEYSIELSNLEPCVTYYYSVVSNNTAGSAASRLRTFTTREMLMIESSGDAVIGQPHNLTCTVECGSANYTSLTWEDSSGTQKTTDGTESRLELHFPMLFLSNVSDHYTCKVNYDNGDSTELTKEIVAEVPLPNIGIEIVEGPSIIYAGVNLTLRCTVTLDPLGGTYDVHTRVEWFKDSDSLGSWSCNSSKLHFHCLMNVTHLSNTADSGSYSCRAVVTPKDKFLRNQTTTSNIIAFTIAVPEITVGISSSTQRLLDVPPYNRFVGSCVASVSVDGLEGPPKVATVMQWWRKRESDSIFNDITDNTFINNGLMSTLQYDEVISGSVMYQCVSILEGVDNISDHDEITVSVVGCRTPNAPEDVQVSKVHSDSVTIQWRVSSIAYTPEIYVVKYGTSNDSLHFYGEYLLSGDDIEAVNKTYSVQLKGLSPGTKYYSVVTANNSCQSNKPVLCFFHTNETAPGRVSFVEATRVNDSSLNITWGPPQPANGNISHYLVWVNSTSSNHLENTTARTLIMSGLTQRATYKVYVAAVNGAGRGEWTETTVVAAIIETLSIEGLDTEALISDGGGSKAAIGAAVTVIVLLLIVIGVLVVVLLLYVRKGNVKQGLETRPSSLLNYIMKSDINEQFDIVSEGKYPVKVTRVTAEAAVMEEEKGENENSGEDELINAGPDSSKMDSTTVEAAVVEEKGENEATVMEKKGEKEASSGEEELIDAGAHSAKVNDTPEVVEETEKREASGEDDEDMKGAEECAVDTTVESDDGEESST